MTNKDISKLRIDKSGMKYSRRTRKIPSLKVAILICILIAGFIFYRLVIDPVFAVEVSTVSQVFPSQLVTLLNASGYVVAQRRASVASKITGQIEWIGVEEGSYIKKGQMIARLEGKDAVAARNQAVANLNNASSNLEVAKVEMNDAALHYNRQKELLSYGIIPQSEFDDAKARYQKAVVSVEAAESTVSAFKAALHSATVAVNYTYIRAPFDAVVLTKDADIGDLITPLGAAAQAKAAVVTVADMDSLLVEADVSESHIQKVMVGQPCEIQLDAFPDIRFRGSVHMIVPTADRTKATVMIKVKFLDKDNRILPEMSARVAILEEEPLTIKKQKPMTVVNANAIVMQNNDTFVFLIEDNRVTKTPFLTGTQTGDMVEVLEGIRPGDKVVINPPKRLKSGSRIKMKE